MCIPSSAVWLMLFTLIVLSIQSLEFLVFEKRTTRTGKKCFESDEFECFIDFVAQTTSDIMNGRRMDLNKN